MLSLYNGSVTDPNLRLQNYSTDTLGSNTVTTDGSGGLVNTYRYDPWGNSVGTTGSSYNEYRYTGSYREPVLGLCQMGARYYRPSYGRFTQLDPLPNPELGNVGRSLRLAVISSGSARWMQ